MGRIRTIKPEFPMSESIGRLSRDARLLLIQLLTIVDDAGRARAAPLLLAGQLYPYDGLEADQIEEWLRELEQEGHIHRYEADGSRYLEVIKFKEHQKIDRPTPSRLPAYTEPPAQARLALAEPSANTRRALDEPSATDLGPVPVPVPSLAADAAAAAFERFWQAYPKRDGDNPKKPAFEKFRNKVKHGVDPEQIIAGARAYADDLERKGKLNTAYVAQAQTWLNQERWRDYEAAVRPSRPTVNVEPNTSQWRAWRNHYSAAGRSILVREMESLGVKGLAFPVPSEWPPPEKAAA